MSVAKALKGQHNKNSGTSATYFERLLTMNSKNYNSTTRGIQCDYPGCGKSNLKTFGLLIGVNWYVCPKCGLNFTDSPRLPSTLHCKVCDSDLKLEVDTFEGLIFVCSKCSRKLSFKFVKGI